MADSGCVDRLGNGSRAHATYDFSKIPAGIAIYSISGPIFFGMIDKFSSAFSSVKEDDRIVVLRMFDVPFIDATGLENLRLVIAAMKKRGRTLMFSEATDAVMAKLRRSHMIDAKILGAANKSVIEVIELAGKMLGG
jgi:SulP family sulfate permease